MSLSNLSSQLASLNGSAVATAASSRKHEDAVGRGLYHSAKHGHAIVHQQSVQFKPSVIHTDAKSAARADIPLVTLRENALVALQFMYHKTQSPLFDISQDAEEETHSQTRTKVHPTKDIPWSFLLGMQSLQYERGLKTKEYNKELRTHLHRAFVLLSSVLGEEATMSKASSSYAISKKTTELDLTSAVLHILEYLIQLYLPHVYNAESLIHAFLPHHETFVFQRIIQLIDLAALPQWSFLRPYTTGSGTVPRSLIAKWAASTNDNGSGNGILLRQVCDLAQRVARLHALEVTWNSPASTTDTTTVPYHDPTVRIGISFVLSFAAALLVEAITVQAKALGTVSEMTVRIVLPFILEAIGPSQDPLLKSHKKGKRRDSSKSLGSTCSDWRGFGYVLAFALNENCELDTHVLEVLSTTAVHGCLEIQSESITRPVEDTEAVAALFVFLLCMIQSLSCKSHLELSMTQCHCLPKISKMDTVTVQDNGGGVVGCYIPPSTFNALIQVKSLPSTLSFLFDQKGIDIKAFVGSLIANCISSLKKAGETTMEDADKKLELVLSLMREKPLEPLWRDARDSLSAAVSAYSLIYVSSGDEVAEVLGEVTTPIKTILGYVQKLDPIGFDLGLAYSLSSSVIVKFGLAQRKTQALVKSMGITISPTEANHVKDNADEIFDNLMPLRGALVHPDPEQRLDAIDRLLSTKPDTRQYSIERESGGVQDGANIVLEGLLHRYVGDKDIRVVAKAAESIFELIDDPFYLNLFSVNSGFLGKLYQGLYNRAIITRFYGKVRSTSVSPAAQLTSTEPAVDALLISLRMSASIVRYQLLQLGILDEDTNTVNDQTPALQHLCLIIQIIFSHLLLPGLVFVNDEDVSERIQVTAAAALMALLGCSTEIEISPETAFNTLISSHLLNRVLQNIVSNALLSSTSAEQNDHVSIIRRAFMSTLVRISSKRKTTMPQTSSLELLISAAVKVLELYDDRSVLTLESLDEASHYTQFLSSSVKVFITERKTSILADIIAKISALSNDRIYDLVSYAVLESIYETLNTAAIGGSFIVLVLEVAVCPNTVTISVYRLLTLVKKFMSPSLAKSPDDRLGLLLLVYILYLMKHKELQVRQVLFDLLVEGKASIGGTKRESGRTVETLFNAATATNMRTQFLMDGASTAQTFLRSVLRSAHEVNSTRGALIRACRLIVTASRDFSLSSGYVLNQGACLASSSVIESLHRIGESDFPLSIIWKEAARPILAIFLQLDKDIPLPSHSKILLDKILVLMKGITVRSESEAGSLVITTIPTGLSHRSRSYSMTGSPEDLSFIDEYPVDMTKAICDCLNNKGPVNADISVRLCEIVIDSVSWANVVFPKFDSSTKKEICNRLLYLKANNNLDKAGDTLLSLPLNIEDILSLLKSRPLRNTISSSDLISVTVIAECVHTKSSSLINSQQVLVLVSKLFQLVKLLSRPTLIQQKLDGLDYTRSSILQALISILQGHRNNTAGNKSNSDLSQYNALLTGLIGIGSEETIIPLISGRGKTLALKLLALICSVDPHSILSTLLPTLISRLRELNPHRGYVIDSSILESDVLSAVIPAYHQNACSVGLSLIDLICKVILNCLTEDRVSWYLLYDILRGVLNVLFSHDETQNGELLASLISPLLAVRIFYQEDEDCDDGDSLMTMNELMTRCSDKCRLASFIFIFRYAGELISYRSDLSITRSANSGKTVRSIELYDLACKGPMVEKWSRCDEEVDAVVIAKLVGNLINVVRENMALMNWKQMIKSNDGPEADAGLKLWQEIVTLQSQCTGLKGISSVTDTISDCLTTLQNQLPIPHFLAAVVSIVNDCKADTNLQKKVIQMLADRSMQVDPQSSEATLFIETITELVDLLQNETTDGDNTNATYGNVLLKQTVLACIEQIARSCECRINFDEKVLSRRLNVFTDALQKIAILMNSTVVTTESRSNMQLFSSAALCASTLIGVVNTRCLSFLPLFMSPLIVSLGFANKWLVTGTIMEKADESCEGVQLLQISILRAIQSIAENLPQSMGSYLDDLLGPACLSSVALRHTSSEMYYSLVRETLTNVDNTLTKNLPPRQILPSLTKAISLCLKSQPSGKCHWKEALSNIHILILVLSSSSRSDLVPVSGKIVQVLVEAFDFDDTDDNRNSILSSSNDAMLGLIMKLSEAQLRPLYMKFREWRGDFDNDFQRRSCLRRQAFWKLSAVLSIELRSIFLPYMSSVLTDAISELDQVASSLCLPPKIVREEKRRKTNTDEKGDSSRFCSVQPLLLALENALRADAQESIGWIAADEGRMYHSLLKPLGKLLTATIPEAFPIETDLSVQQAAHTTKFSSFVGGIGTELYGSVTGCLTALALAGANEVLWKPLNHVILEACSNESRCEVRKAGIGSLLSIIQALGEEYMVLLPECLPVLSELLEDQDEQIVHMAKECIKRGEELLGESLEENLR